MKNARSAVKLCITVNMRLRSSKQATVQSVSEILKNKGKVEQQCLQDFVEFVNQIWPELPKHENIDSNV